MAGINIPIITSFADKGISAAEKAFGKFGKTGVAVGAAFAASTALVVAGLGKAVNACTLKLVSKETSSFLLPISTI